MSISLAPLKCPTILPRQNKIFVNLNIIAYSKHNVSTSLIKNFIQILNFSFLAERRDDKTTRFWTEPRPRPFSAVSILPG